MSDGAGSQNVPNFELKRRLRFGAVQAAGTDAADGKTCFTKPVYHGFAGRLRGLLSSLASGCFEVNTRPHNDIFLEQEPMSARSSIHLVSCAIIASLAAIPAWADVQAGVDAWTKGDYTAAASEGQAPAA